MLGARRVQYVRTRGIVAILVAEDSLENEELLAERMLMRMKL